MLPFSAACHIPVRSGRHRAKTAAYQAPGSRHFVSFHFGNKMALKRLPNPHLPTPSQHIIVESVALSCASGVGGGLLLGLAEKLQPQYFHLSLCADVQRRFQRSLLPSLKQKILRL